MDSVPDNSRALCPYWGNGVPGTPVLRPPRCHLQSIERHKVATLSKPFPSCGTQDPSALTRSDVRTKKTYPHRKHAWGSQVLDGTPEATPPRRLCSCLSLTCGCSVPPSEGLSQARRNNGALQHRQCHSVVPPLTRVMYWYAITAPRPPHCEGVCVTIRVGARTEGTLVHHCPPIGRKQRAQTLKPASQDLRCLCLRAAAPRCAYVRPMTTVVY